MTATSQARVEQVKNRLGPGEGPAGPGTLWRARLRLPPSGKDEFLFRSSEEFSDAATTAQELLETSPSCKMVGAEIIEVARVARLWN